MRLSENSASYIRANRTLLPGKPAIYGVPFDASVSFRTGARFAPNAIRLQSEGLETYSPALDRDLEDILFSDIGDIEFTVVWQETARLIDETQRKILEQNAKPFMIGGDHSITPFAVKPIAEKYPDLVLLQCDAHADLRETFNGQKFSHACAIRRCLDFMNRENVLQYGIRSGDREEFKELRSTNSLIPPNPEKLQQAILPHKNKPIYLTIDLDIFDPSLLPGTGTPEYGGINWQNMEAVINILKDYNLVAADIVELAPNLDPTGCSAILAAKLVRELLLIL